MGWTGCMSNTMLKAHRTNIFFADRPELLRVVERDGWDARICFYKLWNSVLTVVLTPSSYLIFEESEISQLWAFRNYVSESPNVWFAWQASRHVPRAHFQRQWMRIWACFTHVTVARKWDILPLLGTHWSWLLSINSRSGARHQHFWHPYPPTQLSWRAWSDHRTWLHILWSRTRFGMPEKLQKRL